MVGETCLRPLYYPGHASTTGPCSLDAHFQPMANARSIQKLPCARLSYIVQGSVQKSRPSLPLQRLIIIPVPRCNNAFKFFIQSNTPWPLSHRIPVRESHIVYFCGVSATGALCLYKSPPNSAVITKAKRYNSSTTDRQASGSSDRPCRARAWGCFIAVALVLRSRPCYNTVRPLWHLALT